MNKIFNDEYTSGAGFVYVLSNPSMPQIYKIGSTERNVKDRAAELSATTGVPTPFEIVFSLLTENPRDLEIALHREFERFRVNGNREFFSLPLNDLLRRLASLEVERTFSKIQEWEEQDVLDLSAKLQKMLPFDNLLVKSLEGNNADLLALLIKMPSQSVINVLDNLFKQKPQIWRELK